MNRYSWLLIAMLGLTGCSANIIATRGNSTSPYAPVNEKEIAGGILKLHCGESDLAVIREKILEQCMTLAEAQMRAYCPGPYRIAKKAARLDGRLEEEEKVVAKIGRFTLKQTEPAEERIRYLFFDCRAEKNP